MPTNDLVHACDRALAGITEVKAHAVRLAQLEQQIKEAESTLAGLNSQGELAKQMVTELEALDQRLRAKRAEIAELDAQIARKHELHGKVDSDLRDLRRRVSGDPSHA